MPEVFNFGIEPLTCHAWNNDHTQLALSPNNHEVHIYKWSGGKWNVTDVLSEHVQRVTGIDWAPKSNRIVTCGVDRNAYVWTQQTTDGKWKPALVILRINRAATCVRWSPLETKFAVGSGARLISVCYFEQENDWWVSKHIKKPIKSTVTCIDWHPNNILIACGSTDFKARVYSAYIKEVDEKPNGTSWGSKMPFGNLMAEFSNGAGGWVHGVSFSSSGDKVSFVGHDSSVSVADALQGFKLTSLKTECLPFVTLTWITENSLVAAGFDCGPVLFSYDGENIVFVARFDNSEEKQEQGSKFSAMKHFRSLDIKGATVEANDTVLDTVHQNTITQVTIYAGTKANCAKFSTSGIDGQLAIWDIKTLESAIGGLRIV